MATQGKNLGPNEMTINTVDESQQRAARLAGLSYLITMTTAVFANYGVWARLIVPGNANDTARNIIANERLFRISIVCDLVYVTGVVVLLTALYVILKKVNPGVALLGATFRLIYAMMWVVIALNLLDALHLLNGADYLRVFESDKLQAFARLNIGSNVNAYYVGLPFYGLASTVCSYLWFKSKYIPRGLAVWGVISSAWCAVSAFAYIIFPNFGVAVNLYTLDSPMATFEIVTSFWLLFKGLSSTGMAEPDRKRV